VVIPGAGAGARRQVLTHRVGSRRRTTGLRGTMRRRRGGGAAPGDRVDGQLCAAFTRWGTSGRFGVWVLLSEQRDTRTAPVRGARRFADGCGATPSVSWSEGGRSSR
jgi:hypothetical protein